MTAHAEAIVPTEAAAPARRSGGLPPRLRAAMTSSRRFLPVLVLDAVMVVIFSVAQPVFLSTSNFLNILTSISIVWFVAMGMTFVLLSAGFDLSAGAVAAVAGIALARLLEHGVPGWLAIVLAVLVAGVIGGLLNGLLVGRLGLSVFVVTLGTMTALTGAASLLTSTQTLPVDDATVGDFVTDKVLGLPIVVYAMAAVFLALLYVQTRTHFGRDVYAIGGSLTAARLSGIRTTRVIVAVYAIVGACAGLGGVVAAGRIGGAAPQVDGTLPLQAIAAVLLGGTSLAGGLGGLGGTAFGVLFIGILQNGLSLAGVQTFWQQVITGIILVAAVLGDRVQLGRVRERLSARSRPPGAGAPDVDRPDHPLPKPLDGRGTARPAATSTAAAETTAPPPTVGSTT